MTEGGPRASFLMYQDRDHPPIASTTYDRGPSISTGSVMDTFCSFTMRKIALRYLDVDRSASMPNGGSVQSDFARTLHFQIYYALPFIPLIQRLRQISGISIKDCQYDVQSDPPMAHRLALDPCLSLDG